MDHHLMMKLLYLIVEGTTTEEGWKKKKNSSALLWTPSSFYLVFIPSSLCIYRASLVAQMVKNLPAMQETLVWFLGQKDPLEEGMTIHSSILAWRIPWTEEPGGLQSMGSQRVGYDWVTNTMYL